MSSENAICTTNNCAPANTVTINYRKPRYTVSEREGDYAVRIELPGVAKDQVNLKVNDGRLVVTGNVSKDESSVWTAKYGEFTERDYRLSLRLGDEIDAEKISANLTNGILNVELPRRAEVKPMQIAIS